MITYQQEGDDRVLEEALPLFKLHYDEIARYKDIPLDPDFEAYARMEDAGILRVYSARNDDVYGVGPGMLVGYIVFFVMPHPHYKSAKVANQDVLFLLPAYRIGRTAIGLIKFAEQALKNEGVQLITQHVKKYADFGPLLEHLGYEAVEAVYMKRLDVA